MSQVPLKVHTKHGTLSVTITSGGDGYPSIDISWNERLICGVELADDVGHPVIYPYPTDEVSAPVHIETGYGE